MHFTQKSQYSHLLHSSQLLHETACTQFLLLVQYSHLHKPTLSSQFSDAVHPLHDLHIDEHKQSLQFSHLRQT